MKLHKIVFLVAMLFGLALFAEEQLVSREAKASGRTFKEALNNALVLAVEQHCGLTIDSTQVTSRNESEISASSTKLGEEEKLQFADTVQSDMKKWCQGRIASYTIISDDYDEAKHCYNVVLDVKLYGKYVVGLNPDNRRRMVVAPFSYNTSSISFLGAQVETSRWANDLVDELKVHLTQTRKFTMLDREFDAEINKELARANESNASAADFAVRIKQKLATDYLVVGKVNFFNVGQLQVDPYTQQVIPGQELILAEVNYRVLLAPTGQLKWANNFKVDAMAAMNGAASTTLTVEGLLSAAAKSAATRISDEILSSILPFEVVAITKSGNVIIGEGGKSLAVGEQLVVYSLDEAPVDSRTGEALDDIEEEVGLVVITRVTEKQSYAKVLKGEAKVGYRLRRPAILPQEAAPAAPAPETLNVNPNGGVVTPF